GISRSSARVTMYLTRNHALSFGSVYTRCKYKRTCVCHHANPSQGFIYALMEWEVVWKRPKVYVVRR
ncbi:hypothetical protein BDQ17DRAFT_1217999, partial [Cyathus striatus]